MTDRDELNSISFQIIAAVGSARSLYLEAVRAAKEGNLAEAKSQLNSAVAKDSALAEKAKNDVNLAALK